MTGPTRLGVAPATGRSRVHHTTGHLTVRIVDQDAGGARVGLIATRALLLSGDDVRIEVDVAPGAWLDVVEPTGTVAYEGDTPSSWTIHATVGDGAVLTWAGRPFVVSDEITTHRSTRIRVHGTGRVLMQEKVVLGRAGQAGGDLTTSLDAADDTGPVQVEHLDLGRKARRMPGIFGSLRSMDTVTALGWTPGPPGEPEAGTTGPGETYFPLDRSGAVLRWMGIGRFRDRLCDAAFAAWREDAMRDYRHQRAARRPGRAEEPVLGEGGRSPGAVATASTAGRAVPARRPAVASA
ncbi:urease accessory protein UreD [Streptomyces sp. CLV115]|uniref:urease accessory protein UreD n=1 Tax=Streptomyces sp. CLV115 TaxID=3138502 RepID=UPI00313EDE03